MRPATAVCGSLSVMLSYPDQSLAEKVDNCLQLLKDHKSPALSHLQKFGEFVQATDVNTMQELFTRTFEINPVCALEVGWQLFGERYERGTFIVKMRQTLREHGIPEGTELPDHLGHVLKALGRMDSIEGGEFACMFVIPAVEKMLKGMAAGVSPYRDVLEGILSDLTGRYGQPVQGVNHV